MGGVNLYAYCGNDPIENIESMGIIPEPIKEKLDCIINAPRLLRQILNCGITVIQKFMGGSQTFCTLLTACAAGTICSVGIDCLELLNIGEATIMVSCAAAAICSVLSAIASEFCKAGLCKERWWSWLKKNIVCLIINVSISFAAGIMGNYLSDAIKDEIGRELNRLEKLVLEYIRAHVIGIPSGVFKGMCSALESR